MVIFNSYVKLPEGKSYAVASSSSIFRTGPRTTHWKILEDRITEGTSLATRISSRRLQPSETGSLSWGRPGSYCFEPSMFSSGDGDHFEFRSGFGVVWITFRDLLHEGWANAR
jgi:hypothetical protein